MDGVATNKISSPTQAGFGTLDMLTVGSGLTVIVIVSLFTHWEVLLEPVTI